MTLIMRLCRVFVFFLHRSITLAWQEVVCVMRGGDICCIQHFDANVFFDGHAVYLAKEPMSSFQYFKVKYEGHTPRPVWLADHINYTKVGHLSGDSVLSVAAQEICYNASARLRWWLRKRVRCWQSWRRTKDRLQQYNEELIVKACAPHRLDQL